MMLPRLSIKYQRPYCLDLPPMVSAQMPQLSSSRTLPSRSLLVSTAREVPMQSSTLLASHWSSSLNIFVFAVIFLLISEVPMCMDSESIRTT